MTSPAAIRRRLRALGDACHAKAMQWFFKTGPGGYGEGDRFLGIRLPRLRACVRECGPVPLAVLLRLLRSPIHDERMFALLAMVRRFQRFPEERAAIYRAYLAHARWINNWDLVDASAPHIVGGWLAGRSRAPLYRLARSRSVWQRRIAVVATLNFISAGEWRDTLAIAELLLADQHDLIHKASGWILREVGKRASRPALERFLDRHAARMPRTMLRYAIERLPRSQRLRYMARGGLEEGARLPE